MARGVTVADDDLNAGVHFDVKGVLLIAVITIAAAVLRLWIDPWFFWHDDFQTQHLPASYEIGQAWLHGDIPLLSTSSWFAGALAAEFQYGVFSLFLAACNVVVWQFGLSLQSTAAALSIIHLTVTAAGAFLLGRDFRLPRSLAALVALVAS